MFFKICGYLPFRLILFPAIGQPSMTGWPLVLGFGRSQFWKLPWFRSGFQWRVHASQTGEVPRPGTFR